MFQSNSRIMTAIRTKIGSPAFSQFKSCREGPLLYILVFQLCACVVNMHDTSKQVILGHGVVN